MKALDELGEVVRGEQDAQLDAIDVGRTQDHLLRTTAPARAKLPLLLAAAVVTVAALFWFSRSEAPVTFTVAGVAGQTGAWVAAQNASLDISFSDGSTFALEPDSRVRVEKTTPRGARVVVERGAVHADVKHLEEASWSVRLGPYEVHVIGTRFSAMWNAEHERLSVELHEGRVEVLGPHLGDGIRMTPGQRLEVSRGAGEVVLRSTGRVAVERPSPSGVPSSLAPPAIPSAPSAPSTATPVPSKSAAVPVVEGLDWRRLAQARRYAEALAAAKRYGIAQLSAELDAGSLLQLADVSRFAGDGPTAIALLRAVRSRFGGSTSAARAAFLLGTLSPSGPSAAQWFTAYVTEAPQGALVREARGRIVESYVASGATAAAQAAAADYLRAYPDGPHAALARRTLGLAEPP